MAPATVKAKTGSGLGSSVELSKIVDHFRPTKCWRREFLGSPTRILSLDFDNSGDLLMTSESDETIQIYNVKEGKFSRTCLSKKYGVKHAKFSQTTTSIIHASTKLDNTIRYLSTHDNSYLRYFRGHEQSVTCIATNPGNDQFLSCSEDNSIRLWDANSVNCVAKLNLTKPILAAWDPSASVVAIASEVGQMILLYDFKHISVEPFASFDMLAISQQAHPGSPSKGWNKLEFSNDGKHLLIGTHGQGHYVLDAFDGSLRFYLERPKGGSSRFKTNSSSSLDAGPTNLDTSGDASFSPDGRYVFTGQSEKNVLVYDVHNIEQTKQIQPIQELEFDGVAAVLAWNPRYNLFATGDQETVLWLPDPHAA